MAIRRRAQTKNQKPLRFGNEVATAGFCPSGVFPEHSPRQDARHTTRERDIPLGMNAAVTATLSAVVLGLATPYPVVAHLGPAPVRAPVQRDAWGSCPSQTLVLDEGGLVKAKRAALLALPTVAKQVQPALKIRGARVDVLRHTHRSGDILPTRRSCWGTAFKDSALVRIVLPAERISPALRGNLAFYVARTPQAWVVWDQVG
jgi:hypothetical protein